MISAALQEAIDSLQIQDVYVRDMDAKCIGDFNPKYAADITKLNVQQMHQVRQSNIAELENDTQLLQVFIRLGMRWVDPDEANEEKSVRAMIETEFVAEYVMTKKLDQACIDEFSLKNTSYHVWPYWRELLSSQSDRMRLPRLMLPTVKLAHNRHQIEKGATGVEDNEPG